MITCTYSPVVVLHGLTAADCLKTLIINYKLTVISACWGLNFQTMLAPTSELNLTFIGLLLTAANPSTLVLSAKPVVPPKPDV